MQQFLEFIIQLLIDYPDEMVLSKHEDPKRIIFHVRLRQSDVGKVIGKHGHTIAAIRNLLQAAAARHNQRATLEIIEDRTAG